MKFPHWNVSILTLIKSPQVTRGLFFFFLSISAAAVSAAILSTLSNFPGKPLKLISSDHTWLTYGCGKIFLHPSRWPLVKITKLPKRDAIYLVPTIKWEPLIQSLQNLVGISPSSCFPHYEILEKFCKNFFLRFFRRILNLFSPVEHSICHILGMVGPIDVKKRKWVNWMLRWLGYTFDLEIVSRE